MGKKLQQDAERRKKLGGAEEDTLEVLRKLPLSRERKSLNTDTTAVHHVEDHTPTITSWELLQRASAHTHQAYNAFARKLFDILGNARTVTERVEWVVNYLRENGFKELSELTGHTSLDLLDQPEDARKLKAGDRFYEVLKNGLVIAC